MRQPIVGRQGGVRSARPIPLLLLLLVLVNTVGPATAQTDLSGEYEGTHTFDDITPPCVDAGIQGTFPSSRMKVEMRGTSNVDISFYNLPSAGNNTVFNASLNADLNAYAEHENGWTITGQFAVAGADVSFSGRVQWTQECPIDSNNTYQAVPQSFSVQTNRVSGGEEAQAPQPSPGTESSGFPGSLLADDVFRTECDFSGAMPENCLAADQYAVDWAKAMNDDHFRLQLNLSSDASRALTSLHLILYQAARLGGRFVDTPRGRVSRFPVVHALLNVFAFLFVQGVSLAATGRIDSLRATVAQADGLLFAAVSEETRFGRP